MQLINETPPCVWLPLDRNFTINEGDFLCKTQDETLVYFECLGQSDTPGFLVLLEVDINEEWNVVAEGSTINLALFYIIENNFKILVPTNSETGWPSTVLEAIEILLEILPNNQLQEYSNITYEQFQSATLGLGQYIRNQFGMWIGNERLFTDANIEHGKADELSEAILRGLHNSLKTKSY